MRPPGSQVLGQELQFLPDVDDPVGLVDVLHAEAKDLGLAAEHGQQDCEDESILALSCRRMKVEKLLLAEPVWLELGLADVRSSSRFCPSRMTRNSAIRRRSAFYWARVSPLFVGGLLLHLSVRHAR
jgi:hypothetical protein